MFQKIIRESNACNDNNRRKRENNKILLMRFKGFFSFALSGVINIAGWGEEC